MREVGEYVNSMESAVCDEVHLGEWPNCDHMDHVEGRRLVAEIGLPGILRGSQNP